MSRRHLYGAVVFIAIVAVVFASLVALERMLGVIA